MSPEYRLLTITSVRRYGECVDFSSEESIVGFIIQENWLREHGVDPNLLAPGVKIHIKGRGPHGNEDCMLCRGNPLTDIRLA